LRHLANMSCIVPFWASTDSGSVPIWGLHSKPRRPEEVVYILSDSCSHFTQHLFPPKVPQQHTRIISYSTRNIIHTYYTSHSCAQSHLYFIRFVHTSFLLIFMAGWPLKDSCVRYRKEALKGHTDRNQHWKLNGQLLINQYGFNFKWILT
jgi:hypothetical protein